MAKPAQSRCHSFGRLRQLLAVRRARAANSKTSICALDHVAALPRLLSNDEAEALADCTACSSCLGSVLPVSSEWWRCVCGVLGTGSSPSPRRSASGIRLAPKSAPECHRVDGGLSTHVLHMTRLHAKRPLLVELRVINGPFEGGCRLQSGAGAWLACNTSNDGWKAKYTIGFGPGRLCLPYSARNQREA